MSVLVTMRIPGDTDKFREFVQSHPGELRAIAEDAKGKGCLSHRFGVGDGHVLVLDEWESGEQFQRFFQGNPDIAEMMKGAGASGEPELAFAEAIETADRF